MDKELTITYCMIAFAIIGLSLALLDPFDLNLIYAQTIPVEKGINYDRGLLSVNPDGSQLVKLSTSPERILKDGIYQDYIFTDHPDFLSVETAHGSIKLDKTFCAFEFHKKGLIDSDPLFVDSIVPKMANDGTENWNEITQITSQPCETYWTGSELVAKRYASGVGFVEYKYVNQPQSWKTQLEATNLSTQTNKKFGFTQTIDLNRDTINFGGSQKNLDNFDNAEFDRTWLVNNEAKVLQFLNNVNFDFGLGFANLESINVYDTGIDKSKLAFNYIHDASVILPSNTLIVDPTYSYTTGTHLRVKTTNVVSTTCTVYDTSIDTKSSNPDYQPSNVANSCYFALWEFDVTAAAGSSSVSSANVKYSVSGHASPHSACDFFQSTDITGGTGSEWVTDFNDESDVYINDDTGCATVQVDDVIALGGNITDDIQTAIDGDGKITIGLAWDDRLRQSGVDSYLSNTDMQLEFIYVVSPPDPPTSLSCDSEPYGYGCSWTPTDPSLVTGYYISHSSDNSTWNDSDVTLLGNVTSHTYIEGLFGIAESNYIRVNATISGTNSTSSNHVYQVTDDLPDAPSIESTPVSETQIDIVRTAGASDGGDTITHFDIRGEINSSGLWDLSLSNQTIANFYNHTGLTTGDDVIYQWRDRNAVGYSPWSANSSSTSYEDIVATLIVDISNVGDTFNATGILTISNSSPVPVTITLLELINNATDVLTTSIPSDSFNIETGNITPIWYTVSDDDLYDLSLNATLTNGLDTVEISSSNSESLIREYDPVYFTAITPSAGNLNYTIARDTSSIELKMNRDIGGTWKAECLYRTLSEALSETGGTWNNQTTIGYYHDTQIVPTTAEPYYISCYNDSLLFTDVSYLSSTNSLVLGLSIFDEFGGFFGAPSVLLVILALLSLATGRNFPIILLISASVTGILLALELIVLDPGLVVALIVMTGIGLFGIRKFY